MRDVKWIMIVMIAFGLTAQAQESATKQGPVPAQQQNNAQQKPGAQNGDAQAGESAANTPGAVEAGTDENSTDGSGTSADRAANTPAVTQTTSSDSGSPAVLSRGDGKGRDGTNNVQRASPNMAGSPVKNLELDQIAAEDPDSEMKDRQDYTQDKQRSANDETAETGTSPSSGESGEINDNSRRENNEQSDQNISAKGKKNSAANDDGAKDKKPRKKKDKG